MIKNIKPVSVFPTEATQIKIQSAYILPDISADVIWQLLDADNNTTVASGHVIISGEEYAAWGDDDEYLIDLIINKLGLISANDLVG